MYSNFHATPFVKFYQASAGSLRQCTFAWGEGTRFGTRLSDHVCAQGDNWSTGRKRNTGSGKECRTVARKNRKTKEDVQDYNRAQQGITDERPTNPLRGIIPFWRHDPSQTGPSSTIPDCIQMSRLHLGGCALVGLGLRQYLRCCGVFNLPTAHKGSNVHGFAKELLGILLWGDKP